MRELLAIGVGGFLGAIARHLLATTVVRRFGSDVALGTLTVNVLGCFVLGALVAGFEHRIPASPAVRAFLVIGFLGSFTTFSTFGLETWTLLRQGAWTGMAANVCLSLVLGVAAVGLGLVAGTRWFA